MELVRISKNDWKKMSILQKILAQLNICRIVTVFSAVLLTSASSLSAAYFELNSNVNLDSHEVLVNQMECNGLEKDIAGTMYGFLKSGLSLVRKNPLKALTIFLAMQAQGSSFSVPGASAQFRVSNTNQTQFYDITNSNPMVALLPMVINGTVLPCNATIVLSDMNAGNLRSTGTGLSQEFDKGVWTSEGDKGALSTMLSNLQLSIAGGYNRAFNLSVHVYSLSAPTTNKEQGTIQIMPGGVTTTGTTTTQFSLATNPTTTVAQTTTSTTSSAPTTSKNTAVTTTRSNTTQLVISTTSAVTSAVSSSLSNTQDSTESTVSSAVPQIPSTLTTSIRTLTSPSETHTLSPTETSQIPLVGPEGEPPYAIIGGVLGGSSCLHGCYCSCSSSETWLTMRRGQEICCSRSP
jgi:hypothetical protein